jgi:hypothetical protein
MGWKIWSVISRRRQINFFEVGILKLTVFCNCGRWIWEQSVVQGKRLLVGRFEYTASI